MKFYNSKTAKFLAGKGFYLVLAVCVAAVGLAAYSALDLAEQNFINETESGDNVSQTEKEESIILPSFDESSREEEPSSAESEPAEADGVATYFVYPVKGEIIKDFSATKLQFSATYKDMRLHTGIDIKPLESREVLSCGDGMVTEIKEDSLYGNIVIIDHGNDIVFKYCGIKNITVSLYDIVSAGEIIGEVGTVPNECADEEHLHLELFIADKSENPKNILPPL